jgi:hypothetical protein
MNENYYNLDSCSFKIKKEDLKVVQSPFVTGIKTGTIKCYLQKNISKYIYDIKLEEGTYPISDKIYNIKKPNLHENVEIISTLDILGKCKFKIISDGTIKQLLVNGIPQDENPCVEFDYYILTGAKDIVKEKSIDNDKFEFPKENEVVRFIDKENNIDFHVRVVDVKEGKTSSDKIIEFEKLQ